MGLLAGGSRERLEVWQFYGRCGGSRGRVAAFPPRPLRRHWTSATRQPAAPKSPLGKRRTFQQVHATNHRGRGRRRGRERWGCHPPPSS